MDHPLIPPDHERFSTDYKGRAMFLVTAYTEQDCAEIKWRNDWRLLDKLDSYQRENARCIARCAWEDKAEQIEADLTKWIQQHDPEDICDIPTNSDEASRVAKEWKEWKK